MPTDDTFPAFRGERELAEQKQVEHHTKRVYVRAPITHLAPELLRGHVAERSDSDLPLLALVQLLPDALGNPEVRSLTSAALVTMTFWGLMSRWTFPLS